MNNVISLHNPAAPQECVACGAIDTCRRVAVEKFPYLDGEHQVILEARVPVLECASCGTQFTEGDAEEIRHDAVCRYLGRLTPAEVKAVREQYRLSQQEWAARTGFGLASIKRWETGNVIQEKAADRYLRLLGHPDIFERAAELSERGHAGARHYQFQTLLSAKVVQLAAVFELRRRRA